MVTPDTRANGWGAATPARIAATIEETISAFGLQGALALEGVFTGRFLPSRADRAIRGARGVSAIARISVISLAQEDAAVAWQMRQACIEHGYLHVADHGIPAQMIADQFAWALRLTPCTAGGHLAECTARPKGWPRLRHLRGGGEGGGGAPGSPHAELGGRVIKGSCRTYHGAWLVVAEDPVKAMSSG